MSMPAAVYPVTERSTPYSACQSSCIDRSDATRSLVSSESGEPSGITCTMPVSPVSLGVARGTDATPSTAAISAPRSSMSPTGSVLSMTEPVTMSGPLKPGPKCSAMRS